MNTKDTQEHKMFPKLHAYLAHAGVASRRKSEELIQKGRVTVDGKVVTNVAERVHPELQIIKVDNKIIQKSTAFEYYVLNKPTGYVTTVSDPDGKPTVMKFIHSKTRVYPVGRLDIDSEGLVLFTNNGDVANALTHPRFEVPKTYHVLVVKSPTNTQLNHLMNGVRLKEGYTAPAIVKIVKHDEGNTWISITIHEGKHRQVRRMCATENLEVLRLIRVSLGPIELGDLPEGKTRPCTQQEIASIEELIR